MPSGQMPTDCQPCLPDDDSAVYEGRRKVLNRIAMLGPYARQPGVRTYVMNGCCELHPEPPEDMPPQEKWEYWNAARNYHSEEAVKYAQQAVKYANKAFHV